MTFVSETFSNGIAQTVIGGLIAAVAGLVALGVGKRNEHGKWLREQRVEAYTRYLAYVDELHWIKKIIEEHKEALALRQERQDALGQRAAPDSEEANLEAEEVTAALMELRGEFQRAGEEAEVYEKRLGDLLHETYALMSAIELLGPDSLGELVTKLQDQLMEDDDAAMFEARSNVVHELKRILRTNK